MYKVLKDKLKYIHDSYGANYNIVLKLLKNIEMGSVYHILGD